MSPRIESLRLALARLREALQAPETDLTRDAAIQRFEFCFELAWKAIQEHARSEGLDCQSPKGCLKLAFKSQWIVDERGWLDMLDDRNRTTHTYDQQLAIDIFQHLPKHLPLLNALLEQLSKPDENE